MCKVMMMAGIKAETKDQAWSFIIEMAKQISPGNTDGLGYAAVTTQGELFGERWLFNGEAFVHRQIQEPLTSFESDLLEQYAGALKREEPPKRYNRFGVVNENSIAAITLHTRLATSGKQFANTHPFVDGQTSLIHNGVISNADQFELKQSTCDSEAILNLYVKHKVAEKPAAIQAVAKKLQGYFACGVFSRNKVDGVFMDIFKCHRASLGAAFVKELETMVFSTRVEDIKAVCQKLGFTIVSEFAFESNTLLRMDALTGAAIGVQTFSPAKIKVKRDVGTRVVSDRLFNEPVRVRTWQEEEAEERPQIYQGNWTNRKFDR